MSKKSMRSGFLKGATILGIAGLMCKIIGAVYRIPLSNFILHKEGLAYYQIAYPVYTTLLVVSSAGLPTAISRMVAQRVQLGRERDAHTVFHAAQLLLMGIGFLTTAIMALFANQIAARLGNIDAAPAIMAISPALLLVSLLSAYRGYFQGIQNMAPTAISQLIEQLGKLAAGFPLAAYMMRFGPQYGAAGALLGVSLSEALALAFLMLRKFMFRGELKHRFKYADRHRKLTHDASESVASIFKPLILFAIPITIGALIMPLVGLADTFIVINRLQDIGYSREVASNLYGLFTGNVNTIVNMPQVLTVALAMALVPSVTQLLTARRYNAMRGTAVQGMKLSWMIGMPCFVGLFLLAKPVMRLLYSSYSADDLNIMANLLRIMSVAILFLSVVQTTTGILQGFGRIMVPVITLAIGAVLKVIINYVLVGMPVLNIYGAPIGTIVCYATSALLNTFFVCYIANIRFSFAEVIGKPAIAVMAMAFVLAVMMLIFRNYIDSRLFAIAGVIVGAGVYAVMLVLTGAVTEDDLKLFPGGARITRLIKRTGAWR